MRKVFFADAWSGTVIRQSRDMRRLGVMNVRHIPTFLWAILCSVLQAGFRIQLVQEGAVRHLR